MKKFMLVLMPCLVVAITAQAQGQWIVQIADTVETAKPLIVYSDGSTTLYSSITHSFVVTKSPTARFVVFTKTTASDFGYSPNYPIRFAVMDFYSASQMYWQVYGGTDKGITTTSTGETILWFTRDATVYWCGSAYPCYPN